MRDQKAYPEWIIGYDPKMDRQFMIHTQSPRFLCAIEPYPYISDSTFLHELNRKFVLDNFSWLDPAPDLEDEFIPLMARAQEAYEEFESVDSGNLAFEEELQPNPPAPSIN